MSWNDSNVARLKELWDQGLPTAQIGKLLGFTKNAVVGKAHRIGLERRPSPIRRTAVKPDRKKARSPIVPTLKFETSKEEPKETAKPQTFQPTVKNLFINHTKRAYFCEVRRRCWGLPFLGDQLYNFFCCNVFSIHNKVSLLIETLSFRKC